jgi:hypothetical protein
MMSSLLPVGAAAKEPQHYGQLTIQITGAGGSQRTFLAATAEEQEEANYLVTQLGMVTEPTTISASPPSLSQHYQFAVRQQPGAGALLPWSGFSSAEFYYYPGRGATPAYLRCRIGRGSQPDYEAWLIAFPADQSLIEPHLAGLAPIGEAPPTLPLKAATANPPATANLPAPAIALTFLLVAAVVTGIFLLRSKSALLTTAKTSSRDETSSGV